MNNNIPGIDSAITHCIEEIERILSAANIRLKFGAHDDIASAIERNAQKTQVNE